MTKRQTNTHKMWKDKKNEQTTTKEPPLTNGQQMHLNGDVQGVICVRVLSPTRVHQIHHNFT